MQRHNRAPAISPHQLSSDMNKATVPRRSHDTVDENRKNHLETQSRHGDRRPSSRMAPPMNRVPVSKGARVQAAPKPLKADPDSADSNMASEDSCSATLTSVPHTDDSMESKASAVSLVGAIWTSAYQGRDVEKQPFKPVPPNSSQRHGSKASAEAAKSNMNPTSDHLVVQGTSKPLKSDPDGADKHVASEEYGSITLSSREQTEDSMETKSSAITLRDVSTSMPARTLKKPPRENITSKGRVVAQEKQKLNLAQSPYKDPRWPKVNLFRDLVSARETGAASVSGIAKNVLDSKPSPNEVVDSVTEHTFPPLPMPPVGDDDSTLFKGCPTQSRRQLSPSEPTLPLIVHHGRQAVPHRAEEKTAITVTGSPNSLAHMEESSEWGLSELDWSNMNFKPAGAKNKAAAESVRDMTALEQEEVALQMSEEQRLEEAIERSRSESHASAGFGISDEEQLHRAMQRSRLESYRLTRDDRSSFLKDLDDRLHACQSAPKYSDHEERPLCPESSNDSTVTTRAKRRPWKQTRLDEYAGQPTTCKRPRPAAISADCRLPPMKKLVSRRPSPPPSQPYPAHRPQNSQSEANFNGGATPGAGYSSPLIDTRPTSPVSSSASEQAAFQKDSGSEAGDHDSSDAGHETEYESGSESYQEGTPAHNDPYMDEDNETELDPTSAEGLDTRDCADFIAKLFRGELGTRTKEEVETADNEHLNEVATGILEAGACHSIRHTYLCGKHTHEGKSDILKERRASEGIWFPDFAAPSGVELPPKAMRQHLRFSHRLMDGSTSKGGEDEKKRICLHLDSVAASPYDRVHDIDSFMGFPRSLAVVQEGNLRLSFTNQITQRVKTDVHINKMCQWRDVEGKQHSSRVPLKDIPHIVLGQIDCTVPAVMHVFFPNLYRGPRKGKNKKRKRFVNISKEDMEEFYDLIVLPSLRAVLPNDRLQHLPNDYQHGYKKAMASSREGHSLGQDGKRKPYTTHLTWQINARYLDAVNEEMRARSRSTRFQGYFLHLDAKNVKMVHKCDGGFLATLERFDKMWTKAYDMRHMSSRQFYVDIAMEITPSDERLDEWGNPLTGQTYLWRRADLEHIYATMMERVFDGKNGRVTYYTSGMLYDAAEMTVVPPAQCKASRARWLYSQTYSLFGGILDAAKTYPFGNRRVLELAMDSATWIAQKVQNKSGRAKSDVYRYYKDGKARSIQAYQSSVTNSYGVRMEHRVAWSIFKAIIQLEQATARPSHCARSQSSASLDTAQLSGFESPSPSPHNSAGELQRGRRVSHAHYSHEGENKDTRDGLHQEGSDISMEDHNSPGDTHEDGVTAEGERQSQSDADMQSESSFGGDRPEGYSPPHFVWALKTPEIARFYAGNIDKLCRLIDRGIRAAPKAGITKEHSQVLWVLLHTLNAFANCHFNRFPVLWDDQGKGKNAGRLGMGLSYTLPTYRYGWYLSRIDWSKFIFKPEFRAGFAGINPRWVDMKVAPSRVVFLAQVDSIDMYYSILKKTTHWEIITMVLELMCHACFLTFREDLRKRLRDAGDFKPQYATPWPKDQDMPFTFSAVENVCQRPIRLLSGNKSAWTSSKHIFEYLWTDLTRQSNGEKKYTRNGWKDDAFRKTQQRCRNRLQQLEPRVLRKFDEMFYHLFFQTHWVLPYPNPNGTLLYVAKRQETSHGKLQSERVWISFKESSPGQYEWGRWEARRGVPKKPPHGFGFNRDDTEAFLKAELARLDPTLSDCEETIHFG